MESVEGVDSVSLSRSDSSIRRNPGVWGLLCLGDEWGEEECLGSERIGEDIAAT